MTTQILLPMFLMEVLVAVPYDTVISQCSHQSGSQCTTIGKDDELRMHDDDKT